MCACLRSYTSAYLRRFRKHKQACVFVWWHSTISTYVPTKTTTKTTTTMRCSRNCALTCCCQVICRSAQGWRYAARRTLLPEHTTTQQPSRISGIIFRYKCRFRAVWLCVRRSGEEGKWTFWCESFKNIADLTHRFRSLFGGRGFQGVGFRNKTIHTHLMRRREQRRWRVVVEVVAKSAIPIRESDNINGIGNGEGDPELFVSIFAD